MKIVEINTVYTGSTGKIMLQIADAARQYGHEVYTFSRAWSSNPILGNYHGYVGYYWDNVIHRIAGPLTGREGQFSYIGTQSLLSKLSEINPDIIHLHNLHGWYINLPLLFRWIKKNNKKVIWTLHDCWSFTGHCPYFTMMRCDKWITGCCNCPQYKEYPGTYIDNSKIMYYNKKKWFSDIKDLIIVTPSEWLAQLVQQSFLAEYPVVVINNGIDLSVFKPTKSDFRKKYKCENKFILLGVAFGWEKRKGLDVFIQLAEILDKDIFQIVLVGTDSSIDKLLPSNIISIQRTQNQKELAELYTSADLFLQTTREENYPTVNMEAISCGTPVVTFKTGGSPETIDKTCGMVVDDNDTITLVEVINHIYKNRPYTIESCLKKAIQFDSKNKFKEYIELYER